jgi:hypothetical protein
MKREETLREAVVATWPVCSIRQRGKEGWTRIGPRLRRREYEHRVLGKENQLWFLVTRRGSGDRFIPEVGLKRRGRCLERRVTLQHKITLPRGKVREICADCSPGGSPRRAAFSEARVMPQVSAHLKSAAFNSARVY